MLADAFEESVIRANPAARLRLGRAVASAPVKETNALTEEELARVLAEVPEEYRPVVTFLAKTGLRVSEALPLTKADVDFGRRRVRINRRLSEGELDAPKSRNGIREVPLSSGLARSLWTRVATADEGVLLFPGERHAGPFAPVRGRAGGGGEGRDRLAGGPSCAPSFVRVDHVPAGRLEGGDQEDARASLVGLHRLDVPAPEQRRPAGNVVP